MHKLNGRPDDAKAVKQWAGMISSARKLFRVTKFVENWAKGYTQVLALGKDVDVHAVANAAKSVSAGFYFWYDMFQWLHAAKVVTAGDKKRLDQVRAYWWIARIVSSAVALRCKMVKHAAKVKAAADAVSHFEAALRAGHASDAALRDRTNDSAANAPLPPAATLLAAKERFIAGGRASSNKAKFNKLKADRDSYKMGVANLSKRVAALSAQVAASERENAAPSTAPAPTQLKRAQMYL